MILFFIITKELCCSYCYYKNIHDGHKILEINDEQSLQKENISIESSTKEFNDIISKAVSLKEKIESEINAINNLYEKVNKEVTQSFEIKHEKLTKEENNLKEKLENEVTKIKEGLDNFLSESNRIIKANEKLIKGLKIFDKDKEKNIIRTLSYVSKINKNKKETKTLFQELMKNLKISFKEEETNINYSEYYFNGIPYPKDIEVKNITFNSAKLFWKIDNLKVLNIDNKNIKYRVEIKKEKEKFEQVYEGNETNCILSNLIKNTEYEFRICSFYKDIISTWTKKNTFKTSNFECDSKILIESKREVEFIEKIYEWVGCKKLELIYRGSRDGSLGKNFHEKCDNKGPTIILYKNNKGHIFGGYASISWTSDNNYHAAPDCFIFTLINIHNTEPTKFPTKSKDEGINHQLDRGPTFGPNCDITISTDYINNDSCSDFPCRYKDILGKGKSIFTSDPNNNNGKFRLREIEVFTII